MIMQNQEITLSVLKQKECILLANKPYRTLKEKARLMLLLKELEKEEQVDDNTLILAR